MFNLKIFSFILHFFFHFWYLDITQIWYLTSVVNRCCCWCYCLDVRFWETDAQMIRFRQLMVVHFHESLHSLFYRWELSQRHFMVLSVNVKNVEIKGKKSVKVNVWKSWLKHARYLRKEFEIFHFETFCCKFFLDRFFSYRSSAQRVGCCEACVVNMKRTGKFLLFSMTTSEVLIS